MRPSDLQKLFASAKSDAPRPFSAAVLSTFAVRNISLLFGIANAAILARWLGPEGKGIVALALLLPGTLGLFLSGGIGSANVFFVGTRRWDVPTLTANSMGFALPTIVLGFAIFGASAATGLLEKVVPGVSMKLVLLAMAGFPLGLLIGYFSGIFQGLQRIHMLNIINLAQGALMLILTLVLVVVFRLGVVGALMASLGASSFSAAVLGVILRREGGCFIPRWNLPVVRSTLSFALRGHVGNVLQFFNYRLDMFLVNYLIDPAGVGVYSVSTRLAELLWNLPNAVSYVIFPKAAATKPEAMNVFTPRVFRTTLGLTAAGSVGLVLLGRPLILLVYSSAFVSAYVPMLVLLPGVVLLGGAKVLTNEIAGRGYPHYNSITSLLALILTVVFDLLFIAPYGVLGASLASTIAYTAIFFMSLGFYFYVSHRAKRTTSVQVLDD